MANSNLRRQIEQVADNSSGEVVDLLLSLAPPTAQESEAFSPLLNHLRAARVASSARDLLRDARGLLTSSHSSLERLPSLQHADYIRDLKGKVEQEFSPLLQHELVRDGAVARATAPHMGNLSAVTPRLFWSSRSVRISVRRDDISKIVNDTGSISHVALNRRIPKPPMIVPSRIPDPLDSNQLTTWGLEMTSAVAAWGATGKRGAGVQVGLLDTGIDGSHPDLKGKISNWAEFDVQGNRVPDSTPHDTDQHGTHCAGIIAGGNASGKWIGMAPEASLAGALVLGGDHATDAQILAGLEWCLEIGVDVVSMSLGGLTLGIEPPVTYTRTALTAANLGIPLVAAIGNDGSETSTSPGNDVLIISVGGVDHTGTVAAFSGGRTEAIETSLIFPSAALPMIYSKPDISAPGVAVFSSIPGATWAIFSGTSMAAPHVSGAIALLLSATDIRSQSQGLARNVLIEKLLSGTANEAGEAGQNHRYGFGVLNILRCIGVAKSLSD